MDIKELKQLLTKLELKDLEKGIYPELLAIGNLMIQQGFALKAIAEANQIKGRINYSLEKEEEREAIKSTEA